MCVDINPVECNTQGSGSSADNTCRQAKLYFNCYFNVPSHPNNDDKRHYCFGWVVGGDHQNPMITTERVFMTCLTFAP